MTFEQDDQIKDLIGRIEWLEGAVDSLQYESREQASRINNLEGRY